MNEQPHPEPTLAALRQARADRAAAIQRRALPVELGGVAVLAFFTWKSKPHPGLEGTSLGITLAACCFIAALLGMARLGTPLSMVRLGAPLSGVPRRGLAPRAYLPVLALLIASSAALNWLQPSGVGFFGLFFAVAVAARVFSRRVSAAVLAACLALLAAPVAVGQTRWHGALPYAILVALGALYTTSLFARRIRDHEDKEERLLAELEESRKAELRAAAMAERERLAREMHDVLAHSLSGLVVQLEGTRLLAATDPGDSRLPAALDRAHQLAKGGLDEARQAIGMLRGDELPGPERLAGLAAAFEADTAVPCRFTETGTPRELSPEVRLALYRVTQEALTNVRKHARPGRVDVRLDYLPGEVTLSVADFAADRVAAAADRAASTVGAASAASTVGAASAVGGGYGLTGMRERARLLGGSLSASPTAAGFRVLLRVPA